MARPTPHDLVVCECFICGRRLHAQGVHLVAEYMEDGTTQPRNACRPCAYRTERAGVQPYEFGYTVRYIGPLSSTGDRVAPPPMP